MENEKYIFGIQPIFEAIESGKKIEKVMFKQGLEGHQFRLLLERLQAMDIRTQFVPYEKLNKVTKSNHQGAIAYISSVEYFSLDQIITIKNDKRESPLFLILDGVSDVRNFGAIARSAECSGVSAIILPSKGSATINADSIKTSAGALMKIPVCRVGNIREALYFLKDHDVQIVSCTEKADDTIYNIDFSKPTAIIMGSEDKGVSKSALAISDQMVKIPMMGEIGSLNVSAAAAVVLFESVRQGNL